MCSGNPTNLGAVWKVCIVWYAYIQGSGIMMTALGIVVVKTEMSLFPYKIS